LAFTDVMHLFANEFARLRGGRFALALVAAGTFEGFFFRHRISLFAGYSLNALTRGRGGSNCASMMGEQSEQPRLEKLRRGFYSRPAIELAPALLGKVLVRRFGDPELRSEEHTSELQS